MRLRPSVLAFLGLGVLALSLADWSWSAARAGAATSPDKAAVEKIIHDYLLAHPELLDEMSVALDKKKEAEQIQARNAAFAEIGIKGMTDPKIAYVKGPANAKVTVVEFFDYRCPHCKNSLAAVRKLAESDSSVRIALIEFPILTADSVIAARAAIAARRQGDKYLPFHFALLSTTGELSKERVLQIAKGVGLDTNKLATDMEDAAVKKTLVDSNALAKKLQVGGTPTFYINEKVVVGEVTGEELTKMVKDAKG